MRQITLSAPGNSVQPTTSYQVTQNSDQRKNPVKEQFGMATRNEGFAWLTWKEYIQHRGEQLDDPKMFVLLLIMILSYPRARPKFRILVWIFWCHEEWLEHTLAITPWRCLATTRFWMRSRVGCLRDMVLRTSSKRTLNVYIYILIKYVA